jgi:hypothetical protein
MLNGQQKKIIIIIIKLFNWQVALMNGRNEINSCFFSAFVTKKKQSWL